MIEHFWHRLPGPIWFNANEIYREQVMRAGNGAVFIELGAWKGRSTAFMGVEIANSGTDIEFYAVDTWMGSAGESAHKTDPDVQESTLYEAFLENIEPVRDWVKPLRELSTEAATRFGDGSIDFVFVNAGHTYRDVTNDLVAWWPKVRPGGVSVTRKTASVRSVERFDDISTDRTASTLLSCGGALLIQNGRNGSFAKTEASR